MTTVTSYLYYIIDDLLFLGGQCEQINTCVILNAKLGQ